MRRVRIVIVPLALLVLLGCARHVVVERDEGRADSERGIATWSDAEWSIRSEPAPAREPAEP